MLTFVNDALIASIFGFAGAVVAVVIAFALGVPEERAWGLIGLSAGATSLFAFIVLVASMDSVEA